MNFPRWIRSEIAFSAPPNAEVDEIQSRVIRGLEKKGATSIEVSAGRVQFRAERATSTINPLASCRSGSFKIQQDAQTTRIQYELDLLDLLSGTAIAAMFIGEIGLALLKAGSYLVPLLLTGFIALSIPVNNAFCSWRVKALFKAPVTHQ